MVLAAEVELESTSVPSQGDVLQQQIYAKQQAELEEYQRELEREARREAREMRRLEREAQQQQRQLARVSAGSGGSGGGTLVAAPALEITVMRVVGCELLTSGVTGRDFTVVTYAGSKPGALAAAPGADGACPPGSYPCMMVDSWCNTATACAGVLCTPACLPTTMSHAPCITSTCLSSPPAPLCLLLAQMQTAAPLTQRSAVTAMHMTSRWCGCLLKAGSSRPSLRSCTWMGRVRRWAQCRWRSCTRWVQGFSGVRGKGTQHSVVCQEENYSQRGGGGGARGIRCD